MRVQDIDHIDLTVDDLEQAMRFTTKYLTFPFFSREKQV